MRARLAALALVVGGAALGACSVVVGGDDVQCTADADCTRFAAGSRCVEGVCSAQGCDGPDGCFACVPTTPTELHNACTESRCVGFDPARLTRMNPDGTLPPLP